MENNVIALLKSDSVDYVNAKFDEVWAFMAENCPWLAERFR